MTRNAFAFLAQGIDQGFDFKTSEALSACGDKRKKREDSTATLEIILLPSAHTSEHSPHQQVQAEKRPISSEVDLSLIHI